MLTTIRHLDPVKYHVRNSRTVLCGQAPDRVSVSEYKVMSHSGGSGQFVSLFVTAVISAVSFVYLSAISSGPTQAAEPAPKSSAKRYAPPLANRLKKKPVYLTPRDTLTYYDRLAALEAVQIALSEVGDGDSYVWRRRHGRLNGVIQPTKSYKDTAGRVCRHVIVLLNSGNYSRKREGIACRHIDGIWSLDG